VGKYRGENVNLIKHSYRDREILSSSSWRGLIVAACPLNAIKRARGKAFFYARQCCPKGFLGSRM